MTGLSFQQKKTNQNRACFTQSNTHWQLYGYRNNENGTENLWANFKSKGPGRMNLIMKFKQKKETDTFSIKGHSLVNTFGGQMILSGDSLLVERFTDVQKIEPYWGLYHLEESFKNCSSYSCSSDSLYVNFYDDTYTAIFFKVDQFQYPLFARSDSIERSLLRRDTLDKRD